LQAAQLARLAQRKGIADGRFRDVCFQRAMRQLGEQELVEACRRSLSIPGATVELIDFSRFPAPVGELVFPRAGMASGSSARTSLWKGYVVYGGGHHFPVWARVKLRARLNRVVAIDNLVTGKPIRADQVRIEPLDGFPDALAPAQSLDQVVGKNLLRPIRRGGTVSLDDVATAISVHRGDKVEVDFRTPVLRLRFEAIAEMDGRFGDRILLRNLQSRNTFTAEVSGKDQASVLVTDETNSPGIALRRSGEPCVAGGKEEKAGCQ
jgi:flagella basal body P-ring formation protein FlgA